MNKFFLPFLLLCFIFPCSLIACNDNSLDSCPIADRKFFLIAEGKDSAEAATLKQFFDAFAEMVQPAADLSVTWEKPKDNFYIFDVATIDVATGSVENLKMGIIVKGTGNVVLTDVWIGDEHFPALYSAQIFSAPYILAIDPDRRKLINEFKGQ